MTGIFGMSFVFGKALTDADRKKLVFESKSLTGSRTHGGVEAYVQKVTAFGQAQTGLPLQKQLDEIKKEKAEIQNQNDVQKQGNGFGIN